MEKLILKYNAVVGKDCLPQIEEITKRLCLTIESVEEETPTPGKRLKIVSVAGCQDKLAEFGREVVRLPAITIKSVSGKEL